MQHQPEYPSCVELNAEHWAVADGAGTLYIVSLEQSPKGLAGNIVATHRPQPYRPDGASNGEASDPGGTPFLIQSVQRNTEGKANSVTLSFAHPVEKGQSGSTSTTFELGTYGVDNFSKDGGNEAAPSLNYFGADLPVLVDSIGQDEEDNWIVLCSKEYVSPQAWDQTRTREEERKERERMAEGSKAGLGARDEPADPHGHFGEDSQSGATRLSGATIEEIKEVSPDSDVPYSWTQTDETFSLRMHFAPNTPRDALTISIDSTTLELACSSFETQSEAPRSLLDRRKRKWWSDIDPSESTFTYEPQTGVLHLEIVKKDTNIRWPSVFASPEDDEDEDPYAEVPETFDSATLAAVRESFGRIKRRDSAEPEGNHPAIPALLREEMDYDLEDDEDYDDTGGAFGDIAGGHKVGREVQIGSLGHDGARWSKSSSTVVSLPLSGKLGDGIIVKSAVDGLLFLPSFDPSNTPWRHTATTPALSFVLSSKRDLRFTRHIATSTGTTVLAFDSGAVPGSGNVYVYYPPTDKMSARQGVVRVSGGERGALLGVGEVAVGGRKVILALCEKELVVLAGILQS